jgi:hypothetical protein
MSILVPHYIVYTDAQRLLQRPSENTVIYNSVSEYFMSHTSDTSKSLSYARPLGKPTNGTRGIVLDEYERRLCNIYLLTYCVFLRKNIKFRKLFLVSREVKDLEIIVIGLAD